MQIDYTKYSDEQLISMARNKDTEASDYLVNKYKALVKSIASSMFILGAEPEDTVQEGMIGLFKAIRDYDADKEASFLTFASLCIRRQILTAIESSNRKKNIPLNSYISIYSGDDNAEGQESRDLIDEYMDGSTMNPEQVLIDRENIERLQKEIEEALSGFEKQVYELHMAGFSYVDIAKELGRDEKSCDNALQRIKSKIRDIVKN